VSDQNHTTVSRLRKSSPTTPRPRTIQGAKIPPTLALALKKGFSLNGHTAGTVSLRGDVEILKGKESLAQGGMDWLEVPITIVTTFHWNKLRATRKTAELVL
jgi:hypothetical protein